MKWYRIWAIIVRHTLQIPRDFGRLSTLLYWPVIDVLLFGFTAVWLKSTGVMSTQLETIIIAGIILWQILVRTNLDISGSLLEEIWSHNMNNLFAAPLTLLEWITAVIIFSFMTSIFVTVYVGIFSWFVYSFSLLNLGLLILPVFISLFLSGLALGFLASSVLVYYGARVQTLVYMMGFIFMPVSGVSYSLDVLPVYAQYVARLLPMSYTFEVIRIYIMNNTIAWTIFAQAMALNLMYCAVILILFKFMFEKSRAKGLSRLID